MLSLGKEKRGVLRCFTVLHCRVWEYVVLTLTLAPWHIIKLTVLRKMTDFTDFPWFSMKCPLSEVGTEDSPQAHVLRRKITVSHGFFEVQHRLMRSQKPDIFARKRLNWKQVCVVLLAHNLFCRFDEKWQNCENGEITNSRISRIGNFTVFHSFPWFVRNSLSEPLFKSRNTQSHNSSVDVILCISARKSGSRSLFSDNESPLLRFFFGTRLYRPS